MLCGADDFVDMAVFAVARQQFLQEKLGFLLPQGVPSHDTFTRVFARLNPDTLERCLRNWLGLWQQQEALAPDAARHVCIDGKLARGTCLARGTWEHQSNVCALSTVSVFASEMRVMLCCGRLPDQGGEKGLAPSLLELLDLEGAVVTGDAAYCQKDIAHTIHKNKGDYVLVLKNNHRRLYQQVEAAFVPDTLAHQDEDEGHGRQEERHLWCQSVQDLGISATVLQQWPGLASVVRVERVREIENGQKAGTTSRSVWFYLSSLAPMRTTGAHHPLTLDHREPGALGTGCCFWRGQMLHTQRTRSLQSRPVAPHRSQPSTPKSRQKLPQSYPQASHLEPRPSHQNPSYPYQPRVVRLPWGSRRGTPCPADRKTGRVSMMAALCQGQLLAPSSSKALAMPLWWNGGVSINSFPTSRQVKSSFSIMPPFIAKTNSARFWHSKAARFCPCHLIHRTSTPSSTSGTLSRPISLST